MALFEFTNILESKQLILVISSFNILTERLGLVGSEWGSRWWWGWRGWLVSHLSSVEEGLSAAKFLLWSPVGSRRGIDCSLFFAVCSFVFCQLILVSL